ncbi:hypothetical protein [Shimia aestuarii]|uniref:PsbP protein n=1 Tax=Shimia aestuarii TaxID=254406 RepID=A0A1I4N9V7_9RHOB|nr:hypothetical protein [Shimia aestuarii]SFM12324.1 hypothetical protein SAMN04488042_10471 [Shimia aestuarii]
MNLQGVLALIAGFMPVSAAVADTPVHYRDGSETIFSVDVPDFWTVRVGGSRTLTPPGEDASRDVERVIGLEPESDSGVWVGFVVPEGLRTLDEAADYARSLAPQIAKDTEVTEFESRRIAGYPARVYRGTGRRNGTTVHFTVSLIDLPNGSVIFSMTALHPGYRADALEDVNAIYNSIRTR